MPAHIHERAPSGGSTRPETLRAIARARGALAISGRGEPAERRLLGRLGGVLFIVGAFSYLGAALVFEGGGEPKVYAVAGAALASGLGFQAFPWQRYSITALDVQALIGSVIISVGIWATGPAVGAFFILAGVLVGFGLGPRWRVALHLLLIAVLLFAPLIYMPGASSSIVGHALLFLPITVLATGMVIYLRERAEQREQQIRDFASEAIEIADRLVETQRQRSERL